MADTYKFILIDDVASNNLVAKMNIRNTFPGSAVADFTSAQAGYDHIAQHYPANDDKAIALVDIHMPVMDGWAFLEKFDQLDASVKSRIRVYLLSASVDDDDHARATANKNVAGYLLKPVKEDVLKGIIQA